MNNDFDPNRIIKENNEIFMSLDKLIAVTLNQIGIPTVKPNDNYLDHATDTERLRGKAINILTGGVSEKDYANRLALKLMTATDRIKIADISEIFPGILIPSIELSNKPNSAKLIRDHFANLPFIKRPKFAPIPMSAIQPKEQQWLYKGLIPIGCITVLSSDPGVGKTTILEDFCARLSTGRPLYGDTSAEPPANIIFQNAEDPLEQMTVPRLEKMGADRSRIFFIGSFNNNGAPVTFDNIDDIDKLMSMIKPKLMGFDPLQAFIGSRVDMNSMSNVRQVLSKVAQLAEKHQCAVVIVAHNNKGSEVSALHKTAGSIDITAIARSVLTILPDPEDTEVSVLCQVKNNISTRAKGIRFKITDGVVEYMGFTELTADEIKAIHSSKTSSKIPAARNLINSMLGQKGYADAAEILALAKKQDIGKTTIYNAKNEMGLGSVTVGFANKKTYWYTHTNNDEQLVNYLKGSANNAN